MTQRLLKVLKLRLKLDTAGFPTYRAQWRCSACQGDNWLDLPGTLLVLKTVPCAACGHGHDYEFPAELMERVVHDDTLIMQTDAKLLKASADAGPHEEGTLGHLMLVTCVPHLANWLLRTHDGT
ncbi:MAG: hypothetical protein AB7F75_07770 [Planctomycetota bacterium]